MAASQVAAFTARGYRVVSQGPEGTQLVKSKRFNILAFFLLLGVFYLPFYLAKRDEQVFIDAAGGVHGQKWTLGRWLGSLPMQAKVGIAVFVVVIVIISVQ